MPEEMEQTKDVRPVPDPTLLTTAALTREISALTTRNDLQLGGLREFLNEKFNSVDTQFHLIERQRVEQKQDTKAAVDAALAAAKEAVKEQTIASDRSITKSETAISEQLKQMNVTFNTAIAGVTDSISDLKDRVTVLESLRLGGKETLNSTYALVGLLITLALLGVGIITFIGNR